MNLNSKNREGLTLERLISAVCMVIVQRFDRASDSKLSNRKFWGAAEFSESSESSADESSGFDLCFIDRKHLDRTDLGCDEPGWPLLKVVSWFASSLSPMIHANCWKQKFENPIL